MRQDEIVGFIVWALYILGWPLLFYLLFRRGRRAREAVARGDGLRAIAPTLEGDIAWEPTVEGPHLRFVTGGVPAQCHQWLLFEGRTQIVTTFESRVRFRAFLEATSVRALRYPTRSPRFRELERTESFRIVTTDVPWAQEILDGGLREILRELGGRWSRARIRLAIDRFLVEVESPLNPSDAAVIARLVARVAALGGATDLAAGVTFVGGVDVTSHGRCPVCGQSFELAGVSCALCKVPHH